MRRKITSLSLLLLSGAVLFTSCVKDEEQESTKALRTAKETREAEKIAEERASSKVSKVKELVDLQTTYENDIKNAEEAIARATDENASYAAKKTASEADVARKKEDANREIARLNAQIEALQNSVDANYEDLLKQIEVKKAAIEKEENVKAKAYYDFENAEKALLQPIVEGVLKSDIFNVVYQYDSRGSNYIRYTLVTSPVNGSNYVKNLRSATFNLSTDDLSSKLNTLPLTKDYAQDYQTHDGVTLYYEKFKPIAAKNLNSLDATILGLTVYPTDDDINALAETLSNRTQAHNTAKNAYTATPNATTQSALQAAKHALDNAQNALDTAKEQQAESIAYNAKYTAVRNLLGTQANIGAFNALITTYNNGLAGLAQKYAPYVKSFEKLEVLEAEKTALTSLLDGAKVDGQSVAEKISSLKGLVKAQQDIIVAADKNHADTNTRLQAVNEKIIAANTAIKAAKTAAVNYVKAQLAALGVQQ